MNKQISVVMIVKNSNANANSFDLSVDDLAYIKFLLLKQGGKLDKRIAKKIDLKPRKPEKPESLVHVTPVERARFSQKPYKTPPDYKPIKKR